MQSLYYVSTYPLAAGVSVHLGLNLNKVNKSMDPILILNVKGQEIRIENWSLFSEHLVKFDEYCDGMHTFASNIDLSTNADKINMLCGVPFYGYLKFSVKNIREQVEKIIYVSEEALRSICRIKYLISYYYCKCKFNKPLIDLSVRTYMTAKKDGVCFNVYSKICERELSFDMTRILAELEYIK